MKQEAYNTKQRAAELLKESLNIWRQGDHIDQLEGLENDPVFSLLITALAYQANETEAELERFKQDVLDEYARILLPYEVGNALPATAVVSVQLQQGVNEVFLTETSSFLLDKTGYSFMPILRSRAINAEVRSVVRLDGRRWKVTLNFSEPVNDLSGCTFAIIDKRFKDLKLSINGQTLPLIKPWNYTNMPLQPCFAVESLLYNRGQMFRASLLGTEVYARQNVALFYIDKDEQSVLATESDRLELVFDFTGIADDFVFDKNALCWNAVLLVNAQRNTVTLSAAHPMARIAGYNEYNSKDNIQQLMHLLPPAQEQLFGKTPVTVRRIAADRFNHAALTRLVNSLATKFNSDYYAFPNADDLAMKPVANELQAAFAKLVAAAQADKQNDVSGIYLMLERDAMANNPEVSLDVTYLTTAGASINEILQNDPAFIPPAGIAPDSVKTIAKPEIGFDEVRDAEHRQKLLRYYVATNDRIVTPADIKLFCYTALMNRFEVLPEMIEKITVNRVQMQDATDCGYGIYVVVQVINSQYIQRGFAERVPQAEMFLQTMLAARSNGLYPFSLSIVINNQA